MDEEHSSRLALYVVSSGAGHVVLAQHQKSAPPAGHDSSAARLMSHDRAVKIAAIGEECLEFAELKTLLAAKPEGFRLYDGFEPSGRMHIAQGLD